MYQPEALKEILAFLIVCMGEDEQLARGAGAGRWRLDDSDGLSPRRIDGEDMIIYDEGGHSREQAAHIVRHDPVDVLDRIAATRALVALHGDYYQDPCLKLEDGAAWNLDLYEPCLTLRWVATGYARRPGFLERWRAFTS